MASAWEMNYHHSDVEKAAAFLPSLLADSSVRSQDDNQTVHGVLLFADVSGFTALTGKFIQKSGIDRGTDELAETLNEYFCDILGEFLVFGGDILKFAGDALLVLWRTPVEELARTISLVLHCSLQIQKKYRRRETAVGQELQLKIGISAGTMSLSIFGDRRHQYFCIFGQSIGEICEAEELADAGDVVLSAAAWELCEQHRLRIKHLAGRNAVQVTDMEPMSWSECQDILHNLTRDPQSHPSEEEGATRPALAVPTDSNVEEVYRKYIPDTALRKLDEKVPLELFSELRPVTIIFIQLQLPADVSRGNTSTILNSASSVMLEILAPHQGKINKVLLCDKGCTFLCVLGLAGNKLPSESAHALQCALQIHNACSIILGAREAVSVAVTSGMTFCGIIGHPLRHEYTVIGQKVNLAARMMIHYPGLVSCDAVTYAGSRLPHDYFRELPEKEMRGISQPGPMYQYMGISKESIFGLGLPKKKPECTPLLGRKQEIELFLGCLSAFKDVGQRNILAFEGTMGSGKSHLLTELVSLGRSAGHRVVSMKLLEINMRQSFSALRMLMARALGLQDCDSFIKRQRLLKKKLQGTIEESSYCFLNDIFLVEFPISDKVREMRETQRRKELYSAWTRVLEKILGGEFGIFVIDNAHFIDPSSWSIMSGVIQNVSPFMVLSLAPGYARTESFRRSAADGTMSKKITYVHLDKLNTSAVVQKACKDLGVVSISRDLVRFLMQKSSGIPYHCEELLRCLHSNNMLSFYSPTQAAKAEEDWESLINSAVEASFLTASGSSNESSDDRACIIRPGVTLETTVLPVPLKEIALTQLDRMNPLKQMILKFAAVIGTVFTTQMLSYILPMGLRHQMNPLLEMLVSDKILKWVKTWEAPEDEQDPPQRPATSWHAERGGKTKKKPSGALAFCVPLLQETTYELWPHRQRVTLHHKCAAFLERHAHRCESCGHGDFVPFHRFTLTSSREGGSRPSPADQDDPYSWEALVLVGEQLRRKRTCITGDAEETQSFDEEDLGVAECDQAMGLPINRKQSGDCSCQSILESVLVPLAWHCLAVDDADRAFYYLLESAAGYLQVSNSYMALMKLKEAEVLRETKTIVTTPFEEATFFSLKGEVCCYMNCIKLAKKMIRQALSLLERHFPRSSFGAFFKSQLEKLPCAAFVRRAATLPRDIRRKRLASLLRQSCCLSLLEHLFRLEGTSSGRRFSSLAARMKANTDREANSYQAADDSHQ